MSYKSLKECIADLEKNGMLLRIKEEVDPDLLMSAMQLEAYATQEKALYFEKIKGCNYPALSNLFGTKERTDFIFRGTADTVKKMISLRNDPIAAVKSPLKNAALLPAAYSALPQKISASNISTFKKIGLKDLPHIKCWPDDGGAFITLPQVYTEDIAKPGIAHSNLGMYRMQLNGNDYTEGREIGLHYQIHRGIGVHQQKAIAKKQPLRVSVFIGGPPSHTVAAVMPLPEGMSEINFAGLLAGRRFRYFYHEGYCISADADFVITGTVNENDVKTEGPFGDHLGYYSLRHLFPVLQVDGVYAKPDAVWPFTVVGRPPQEDTSFGALIHDLTGEAISNDIPGVKTVHAVDAAGVHPLLLATGSERYTPYNENPKPAELLTLANRILGTGQLSLAKYLLITAGKNVPEIHDIPAFLGFVLKRIRWERDLHFQTKTTIDTLDYSGERLNEGSKVIMAAYGDECRMLRDDAPPFPGLDLKTVLPGVACFAAQPFSNYENAASELEAITSGLANFTGELEGFPLLILADEPGFVAASLNNFLWITFTRSNPANDIYGVGSFVKDKHWGCRGPLIIDARLKPHHAPPLLMPENILTEARALLQRAKK